MRRSFPRRQKSLEALEVGLTKCRWNDEIGKEGAQCFCRREAEGLFGLRVPGRHDAPSVNGDHRVQGAVQHGPHTLLVFITATS